MGKTLCLFINYLRCKILKSTKIDEIIILEDFPEKFEEKKIYLRGKNKHLWSLALLCPCNCGDVLYVNLISGRYSYWTIKWNFNGTISINPSIWRTKNCKSHFFYKKGKIKWCW